MAFESHISGKNAHVTIWPDRVEWRRGGGLFRDKQTNAIPTRTIQSVTTQEDGGHTKVIIRTAGGEPVAMRVSHGKADKIRELIMQLVTGAPSMPGGPASAPSAPPPPHVAGPTPTIGVAEELRQLAELKESGVLTEEEFAAQKARLLGNG